MEPDVGDPVPLKGKLENGPNQEPPETSNGVKWREGEIYRMARPTAVLGSTGVRERRSLATRHGLQRFLLRSGHIPFFQVTYNKKEFLT